MNEQENYPNEKIDTHVINVQVKKGLKKKDFFFDKVQKVNSKLLEVDIKKIEERVAGIKPFSEIYERLDKMYARQQLEAMSE